MRTLFTKQTSVDANFKNCCNIDHTLKSFWGIESTGTDVVYPKVLTQEEKAALEKVKRSMRVVDGTYQVGIP